MHNHLLLFFLPIYELSHIIKSSERLRLEGILQDTILYSSRLSRVRKNKEKLRNFHIPERTEEMEQLKARWD